MFAVPTYFCNLKVALYQYFYHFQVTSESRQFTVFPTMNLYGRVARFWESVFMIATRESQSRKIIVYLESTCTFVKELQVTKMLLDQKKKPWTCNLNSFLYDDVAYKSLCASCQQAIRLMTINTLEKNFINESWFIFACHTTSLWIYN